jgi:osmoprotectant transport system substrate-binding protein
MPRIRKWIVPALGCGAAATAAWALAACGSSIPTPTVTSQSTPTQTTPLPGAGKPTVTIGDKNYTEQFILGELYYEALKAKGFSVQLNRNIGPTEVTLQDLQTGRLGMYPEYLNTWNSSIAGIQRQFASTTAAYNAGQRYALAHGLELLDPTPFSDTWAIGVTDAYAMQNGLRTIGDLQKVAPMLTFGASPQFQQAPGELPALEQAYGFQPAAFKPLEIGQQYQALDRDTVQAAAVMTTDGQLTSGDYMLLKDPLNVFGIGNVVPVVPTQVADAEGPVFVSTINKVSALLTMSAIRALNAAVDVAGQDPGTVARQFLADHGLVPPQST